MSRIARTARNPVAQFLAVGAVLLVGLVWITSALGARAARAEAVSDSRRTTELLAYSVGAPALTDALVAGDPAAVVGFGEAMSGRLLGGDVKRIKIWRHDGTVVWSDEPRLIGESYDLDPEELAVLEGGGTEDETSDLSEPENRFETESGLVEVYTQVHAPGGEPLLFEAYFATDDIEQTQAQLVAPFRAITVGMLVAVVVVASSMLWVLTRRLTSASEERERLLRDAGDASDAERRRIARDLHDGVVQDLAGTSFAISALARTSASEHEARQLDLAASSLRSSMRALRSLLVEIHPPGLTAADLPAALHDLTAGADGAGVEARVRVDPLDGVADETVALIWRVAQEAIRNALRHARAAHVDVTVERVGRLVRLTVVDDGSGFDPAVPRPDSYGLRGLASLARDHGGRLEVRSDPGLGSEIRLEAEV